MTEGSRSSVDAQVRRGSHDTPAHYPKVLAYDENPDCPV